MFLMPGSRARPKLPFRKAPTQQIFTSGSGTYHTPANVLWLRVRMIGGGGGGGGGGTGTATAATGGSNTTFGGVTAGGGGRGADLTNAAGSAASAAGISNGFSFAGSIPSPVLTTLTTLAELGTPGFGTGFGSGTVSVDGGNGQSGTGNTGAGGAGGASTASTAQPGGSGGSGAYVEMIISSPAASYSYTVGGGGSAGSNSANGFAGGAGGSGIVIVEEHYNY